MKHLLAMLAATGMLVHAGTASAYSNKATVAADVFFAQDSDAVAADQKEKLRAFVDRIDRHQLEAVIAVGHASPAEPDAQALSERRAVSAKFELIQLGVPPYRIYTEGQGDRRASDVASAAQMRRTEIEYVGSLSASSQTRGFNTLWTWHRDFRSGMERSPLNTPPGRWDASPALQFLPAIADPALRLRFLEKYRMVAIREKDDVLLRTLEGLRPAGAPAASAQTALMAFALGTPFAQSVFASAIDRLDVADPGGRAFAEQLWCDGNWRPTARDAVTQRMKTPQMLRSLSAPEQKRWTECAARHARPEALEFLKSNGVNLSARDEQGRTALHGVVGYFSPAGIRTLVAAGADCDAQDANGRTPLHGLENASNGPMMGRPMAAQLREAWNTLVAAGASSVIQDQRGAVPAPVKP